MCGRRRNQGYGYGFAPGPMPGMGGGYYHSRRGCHNTAFIPYQQNPNQYGRLPSQEYGGQRQMGRGIGFGPRRGLVGSLISEIIEHKDEKKRGGMRGQEKKVELWEGEEEALKESEREFREMKREEEERERLEREWSLRDLSGEGKDVEVGVGGEERLPSYGDVMSGRS